MTEKFIKGDVVKVVGGKYKGEMGVVVYPTNKMYYIRLKSHKEVRLMASSMIKEKKGDGERSIVHSFEAAEKIVEHLKCKRKSNENADTKAIEIAEKISEELCLI
jgi:hypothetical protein